MNKFSERISIALEEQGRSKKWLAGKLGIYPNSLSAKLRTNTFSLAEIFYISTLLNLEEDGRR